MPFKWKQVDLQLIMKFNCDYGKFTSSNEMINLHNV